MVKAILFDLDGTLLHTLPDLCACMNAALRHYRFPAITLEQTRAFVGHGGREFMRRALPPDRRDLADECYAYYREIHVRWKNENTKMFEGEAQFLKDLERRGVKKAIVTNKAQNSTEVLCRTLLGGYSFDVVIGNDEKFPAKPDPSGTLAVLEKLGVRKEKAVFVGDGDTDVQTARNAGIRCVSVLWGYRSRAELSSAGATCFAETFTELEQKIFNPN